MKQVEVFDTQKAEAKTLQKNIFRAFDEIDEMSQRYSEDVEAGTEIAKQIGGTFWTLGSMGAMALLTTSVIKGKFPLTKVANWLTNISFDAKSTIKKAVNNLNDVLKTQGKAKTREFQQALVKGKIEEFLSKPENKAMKDAWEPLSTEFKNIGNQGVVNISTEAVAGGKKKASEIISELFSTHFKQTAAAKWVRNMITDCTKLWTKSKLSKADVELSKEVQEQFGLNFNYKNYKTLINTGIVAGLPVLGVIFAVPYAFNAWLTNIQKKAGKIGIMKAMDKIDDPRVFASEMQPSQQQNQSNLLKKIKQ